MFKTLFKAVGTLPVFGLSLLGGALIGLLVAEALASATMARDIALGPDIGDGLPADRATRQSIREQMTALNRGRDPLAGPAFQLPEDQRAGWIAAWNKLRDCARAQGFDGVSPVGDSYGDGRTPAPVIVGSDEVADQALRACPFDTSLFDAEKVAAEISEHSPDLAAAPSGIAQSERGARAPHSSAETPDPNRQAPRSARSAAPPNLPNRGDTP